MDKSAGNKKRSPAGTTRRAYSIFGGIINLAQQQQHSHTAKSNVLSSPGNAAAAAGGGGGGGGGTSQDPQGSTTNVYTVTVTNSESPDNTNQVKTYENLVPVKKQKGDQSTSAASSLTPNSSGMSSNSGGNNGGGSGGGGGGGGRIGPAPRTLSILTALNELAISDEIEPNPTCSPLTPSASTGNNRASGAPTSNNTSNINNVSSAISKSNPTHSSCHYPPPKRTSYGGNTYQHHQQQQQHHHHFLGNKVERTHENLNATTNIMMASSNPSASALHHHHNHHHHQQQQQQYILPKHVAAGGGSGTTMPTSSSSSVYHSASTCSAVRGLYSTNSNITSGNNVRMSKGYNEQLEAPPPPLPPYGNLPSTASKFPFSITSPYSTSTGNTNNNSGGGSSNSAPTTNTLPLALRRSGNKSRGSHKESSTRKGSSGGVGTAAVAATKQRDRSKSRTPDWIWKIFQLTKHGKLEELQQSLLGLDPTLIRHLADAKGNTVLHCAARGGHVNTLQWLVSVLGSQCTEAALNDHNQAGRTVILTALKKGQLECVQWLVHQTKCGEKALVPNEGERSLLHHAATIGDLSVVRWLCSELIDKGICVDIRDAGGMTPLHDAAKSGHITVCHELILAGADPLSQTELGWRPSDLAIRHRHMECASYFMVAEAAGSLGNQLHSLLLAFNHLRQEHEELRLHFRETLRVGKWLAKERNDLIKQFPAKWTQEAGSTTTTSSGGGVAGANATAASAAAVHSSSSSMLLGGTNNGTRFSDLEHKLVVAEQAWKKLSQNSDKTGASSSSNNNDEILNGKESSLSNVSRHDFLHRRLAAVQLRHERSQSLGNSQLSSGSSDEDPCEEENSSSSDASSSDVDVERITSVTAGSGGSSGMMSTMAMMMMGQNSPAITHSSTVSPSLKNNSGSGGRGGGGGGGTMRTRPTTTANTTSKAAPWLLPPNDAFLSQLSPFVGTHGGKSLPTLDLLNGAPTSQSLLSSIVSPLSTSSSAAVASTLHHPPSTSGTSTASPAVAPAITTDTAGKNEKSLVQMDTERHGSSNHAGKRDSTSLEISVLEVIEPTTHASPASSSFKKNFHQAPDLICGTQYGTRHVDKQGMPPQKKQQQPTQSLSLRDRRQRKDCYYSHSEENLVGYYHLEDADGLYEPISPYHQDDDRHSCQQQRHSEKKSFPFSPHHYYHQQQPDNMNRRRLSNPSFAKNADFLDTPTTICKGESSSRKEGKSSFSSTSQLYSKGGNEQLALSRPASSLSVSVSAARRKKSGGDNEQRLQTRMMACAHASSPSSSSHERSCDNEICFNEAGKVNSFPNSSSALASGAGVGGSSSVHSVEVVAAHSGSAGSYIASCDNASSSGGSNTRNIISKSRTPSPKSYVTKLTVIPVEATTETCFLSVRSTSFAHKEEEEDGVDGEKGDQRQHQQCTADGVVEVHPDHHYHHHEHHHRRHEEGEDEEEEESHQLDLPGDNPDELCSLAFSCQIPSYSVSSSNTPVMPRFNSSGTVVFPLRKPSSDWHSTELLSLTTPDSSLAGRLSPTPSETSRTESALAPPPSYVSHASQNSEVSKTESARGHHHHHHQFPMNEVSAEERDLESPVGDDGPLHLQTSFINHPPATGSHTSSSPFQTIHPHHLALAVSSAQAVSQRFISSQSSNSDNNNSNNSRMDSLSHKMASPKNYSAMLMVGSFEEMCESDRKKSRDYSSVSSNNNSSSSKKNLDDDDDKQDDHDAPTTAAATASSSSSSNAAATTSTTTITAIVDDNDDGDHVGDNDRSSVKQRGLFEKQQSRRLRVSTPTTSTTRFIRSHLSTTTANNNNSSSGSITIPKAGSSSQQQHHRFPKSKGHHHHPHNSHLHQRGLSSKPWYEIEGSDDEGSLLRVAKSRANHSSNFSNSINSTNSNNNSNMSSGNSSTTSSSNNAATSTTTSNPEEESSSQNDSAAEENENNNSVGGGGGCNSSSSSIRRGDGGIQAEPKEDVEVETQKVGQSSSSSSSNRQEARLQQQQQQQQQHQQQQQNSSTTVTSNRTRNCSNFL